MTFSSYSNLRNAHCLGSRLYPLPTVGCGVDRFHEGNMKTKEIIRAQLNAPEIILSTRKIFTLVVFEAWITIGFRFDILKQN
jgi:hypothetical protein